MEEGCGISAGVRVGCGILMHVWGGGVWNTCVVGTDDCVVEIFSSLQHYKIVEVKLPWLHTLYHSFNCTPPLTLTVRNQFCRRAFKLIAN